MSAVAFAGGVRSDAAVMITDTTLRDGIQFRTSPVTRTKALLYAGLADVGLKSIEIGAFVRSDVHAQFDDIDQLCDLTAASNADRSALVANVRGVVRAVDQGLRSVAITQSAEAFAFAVREGLHTRVYPSSAGVQPFRDPAVAITNATRMLLDGGADEVVIADESDRATLDEFVELLFALGTAGVKPAQLALHLHAVRDGAAVKAAAALDWGIRRFDTTLGGVGGHPISHEGDRWGGNLSTQVLCALSLDRGLDTGVDSERLDTLTRRFTDDSGSILQEVAT